MLEAEIYTEPFRKETFIIVPLDGRVSLSQNIRTDLNNPLRFLLLVEDTSGRIRRGDVLLFYPADENLTKLPDSSFTNFFIFESMKTDGTFSLISLSDVKQYEMDFTNGSPGEFRLWQGRASIYTPPPDHRFV